ncbi:MAG: transporter substrate-binding domain-containing protein [Hyphomicrobiaceae bacterium]|nr:transporter substrate-binding domain-containing protein [Hyphomicrobiaceae bacterium]
MRTSVPRSGARRARAAVASAAAAILVGIVAGLPGGTAMARPLDDVLRTGVLRVVVYYDNAPFSAGEGNDDAAGVDVDLGRALAAKLGVKADVLVRTAGEEVDDDVRSNIWQGPRTGGLKGDVMLHVPMDRELIARNPDAVFINPYHHEETVIAFRADRVSETAGIETFRNHKVAVKFSTAAHYYLAFADEGAYRNNVSPFRQLDGAVESFLAGESIALMGTRSEVEAALRNAPFSVRYTKSEMTPALRASWTIGMAVAEDSRDLGHALAKGLRELRASGELKAIFDKHGVSLVAPPTY